MDEKKWLTNSPKWQFLKLEKCLTKVTGAQGLGQSKPNSRWVVFGRLAQ